MLSKNQLKRYAKLKQKKYRDLEGLFIAEGVKLVKDLIRRGVRADQLIKAIGSAEEGDYQLLPREEFKRLSSLDNPSGVLGVFQKPSIDEQEGTWIIALDGIRDPGNLGTILRCADWFGISRVICSLDTVDCYNPKTVQASMGSVASVSVDYCDLAGFLKASELPVYGTFMAGKALSEVELPEKGILVLGNEGQGIRENLMPVIDHQLKIGKHPNAKAESLNVAAAAAVFMWGLPIQK